MSQSRAIPPIPEGAAVRFTRGPLGLVEHPDSRHFEPETVGEGDVGSYVGPHPSPGLPGWHLIEVAVRGRGLLAPVDTGQFEVVGDA